MAVSYCRRLTFVLSHPAYLAQQCELQFSGPVRTIKKLRSLVAAMPVAVPAAQFRPPAAPHAVAHCTANNNGHRDKPLAVVCLQIMQLSGAGL